MPDNPPAARSVKTPTRLKRLAYLLDSAIPLPGGRSIGLEAVVGLIPGIGDIIGALASCYIVAEGVRMGAPKRVIARMIGNVLLESTVGVVPVVGDLFDMVYKSNMRNIDLLLELEKKPVTDLDGTAKGIKKKNRRLLLWAGLGVAVILLIMIIWLVFEALAFIVTAIF